MAELKDCIFGHEVKLDDQEERITDLEHNTRKRKIPPKKDQLLMLRFVPEKYDNRCSICAADMHGLAECDHFTRVDRADKDNCWIICRPCNRSLGMVGGDVPILLDTYLRVLLEWKRAEPFADPAL